MKRRLLFLTLLALLSACGPAPLALTPVPSPTATVTPTPFQPATPTVPPSATDTPPATPVPSETPLPLTVRFAVIGDYGLSGAAEADVAALVRSWAPDLILTTGDNNYPVGAAGTIDENIGQYYREFIFPYAGGYGPGAAVNRFFPTLGNHDWVMPDAQPYLDYFSLPGNERYYEFLRWPVHFFALDSDEREPDGFRVGSLQADWLRERLAASAAPWQIVYMHHAPYSSGAPHGSTVYMQWPFGQWGADAVLAGHDHTYERLEAGGIPYFVNGLGGHSRYDFAAALPESRFRYNADFGAMLVTATARSLLFQFFDRSGALVDQLVLP